MQWTQLLPISGQLASHIEFSVLANFVMDVCGGKGWYSPGYDCMVELREERRLSVAAAELHHGATTTSDFEVCRRDERIWCRQLEEKVESKGARYLT